MATIAEDRPTLNQQRSARAKAEPRGPNGRFAKGSAKARKSTRSAFSFEGTGGLLAAGAAGLAVGLAANVARKLAVQAPTYASGDWDVALANEHKLTLKVFDAIEATTERNTVKRATLLANLKHMLAKHSLEEENVIYPALRDAGHAEAADDLTKDHGYVKQYLYDLSEMPKDSPAFIAKVRAFRTDLERHMREEEEVLFPKLRQEITAEKAKELTSLLNREGLKMA